MLTKAPGITGLSRSLDREYKIVRFGGLDTDIALACDSNFKALNNFVDFVLNLKWKQHIQSKHVASA